LKLNSFFYHSSFYNKLYFVEIRVIWFSTHDYIFKIKTTNIKKFVIKTEKRTRKSP
jgi:hypothetical protein